MTISYTHSLHKMYPMQLKIKLYYQQLIFLELNPTVDSFFPFISECVIRDLLGFPDHGSIALAATRYIPKATEIGQLNHELWLVEVVDGTHWLRDEVAPHFEELKESLDICDGSGVQGCTALQLTW